MSDTELDLDMMDEQYRQNDDYLSQVSRQLIARLRAAEARVKELEAALPRCTGNPIGGSGGHMRFEPCGKFATFEVCDSLHRYACDEHSPILHLPVDRDELDWADLVRKP